MLPRCDHLAGYFRTPHRRIAEEEGQSCWVDTRPLARRARSHSFADVWAPPGETGSEADSVHHVGCGEEHGVEGLEKRGALQVPPIPPTKPRLGCPLKNLSRVKRGSGKWKPHSTLPAIPPSGRPLEGMRGLSGGSLAALSSPRDPRLWTGPDFIPHRLLDVLQNLVENSPTQQTQ